MNAEGINLDLSKTVCRDHDRAGVMCGTEAEVNNWLSEKLVCDQQLLEKSFIAKVWWLEHIHHI